jgi:type I restriction enzyme S subunit
VSIDQLITAHLDIWTAADSEKKSGRGRSSGSAGSVYGVKKLRELILELAVRGKLVPQDESDEPASELLKKIATEKAKLIAEGKIKKDKPLSEITDDEKPFELPVGWTWVFLPDVSEYKVGKTPSTKSSVYWTTSGDGFNWVSIADLNHDGSVFETTKQITDKAVSEVFRYDPAPAGTILMSFKLTLGKISTLEVPAFHNEAIISIYPNQSIFKDYLFKVLPARAMAGNSKSAIKGNTLNSESIAALMIPLPPIYEQHRIVVKVDKLMALCDQLKSRLTKANQLQQKLADVMTQVADC